MNLVKWQICLILPGFLFGGVKLSKFQRLACILCCILLWFTGCGDNEQKEEPGSTVQVKIGNVYGNGVIWEVAEGNCVIATAGHILSMGEGEIQVVFPDGVVTGVSDYWTTDVDLAFLVVEGEFSQEGQNQYSPVIVDIENTGNLQADADVTIKTFGKDTREDSYGAVVLTPWIYVEDFGQYMLLLQTEVSAGMSGAGVFDKENRFLGIICGGNEEGEAVATPVSVVRTWYQNCKE